MLRCGIIITALLAVTACYASTGLPKCPVGLTSCAVGAYPNAPGCFNKTNGQFCCGARDVDCVYESKVQVCSKNEHCCQANGGCEHGGTPKCCPTDGSCCAAMDGSLCGTPDEQCCDSAYMPSVCPKTTTCCPNTYGSACCKPESESCCSYGHPFGTHSACCTAGQSCDPTVGCVDENCVAIAGHSIQGPVMHSALLNTSDECCALCAVHAGCKGAVATLLKPHRPAEGKSQRAAAPVNILCELKASDTVIPKRGSTVLQLKK